MPGEPLTVLMPVLNAMPHLRGTLGSLAAQTYRGFRLLAWDNGSTDGSVEELMRWVPHRIPGRVVRDRPLRLGPCRAALVESAPTELCAWCDADDINTPDRFDKQVRFATENPRFGVVTANVELVDGGGRAVSGSWRLRTDDAEIRYRLRFHNSVNQGSALFRRSVVLHAGNYRDIAPGQDYDMWIRVAAIAPIGALPDVLLRYVRHDANLTSTLDPAQAAEHQTRIVEANAPVLFPGVDRDAALVLRERLVRQRWEGVELGDIMLLRRIAVEAARASGLSHRAFLRTVLYREQARALRLSWLKRFGVVRAMRSGWRRARGMDRPGRTEEPMVKPWPTDRGGKRAA